MSCNLLLYDTSGQDSDIPRSPPLQRIDPVLRPEIDSAAEDVLRLTRTGKRRRRREPTKDPANASLLAHLDPNHTEHSFIDPFEHDAASETDSEDDTAMTALPKEPEQSKVIEAAESKRPHPLSSDASSAERAGNTSVNFDARTLKDRATAVLEHAAISAAHPDPHKADPRSTNYYTSEDALPTRSDKRSLSGRSTPLRLRTHPPPALADNETITTSPNLSKHVIPVAEGADTTLPAMHSASPIRDGTASSPQTAKLPSLHQITGQIKDPLNAFAEVAALADPRGQSHTNHHHHSHSFGSATSQSPTLLYHNFPSTQASPSAHYPLNARSPTSAVSEHFFGSPQQHHPSAYFADRRTSAPSEHAPKLPPSLPSASSSGESPGHASSTTTEGYSTAQTTPSEATTVGDGTPRPTLPPPPGMAVSGYKCDHDGCTAPLFQTQYLLSSHQNVHSDHRNHFCPYEGCPRGEGGRGFKRKNEMIRHQLVHKSPGYVCPFCPDREHKYPRPDNLQRHVRVHHMDKDRNDPQLCEVLAKRNDGAGKARRRRTTSSSV